MASSIIKQIPLLQKLALLLGASAFLASSISFGDVYLYHIVSLIFLAIFVSQGSVRGLIDFDIKKLWPWILFALYSLISVLWADQWNAAIKYNAYLLTGSFLIFFLSFNLRVHQLQRHMFQILIYLFVAHLIFASMEILTPFRWIISEYSKLNFLVLRPVYNFPEFFNKYPTSFFWHQNNCALVTLLGLPFIFKNSTRVKALIGAVSYFVIFMSGSKSIIFLSLLYGALSVSLKLFKKPSLKLMLSFIGGVLLMASAVLLLANKEQKDELSEVASTVASYVTPSLKFISHEMFGTPFDFEEIHINVRERYLFMDGAINLYKRSPILGAGAGSHLGVPVTYRGKTIFLDSLHNFWLEIFVLYGIGSILFFYGFFLALKISKTYRHSLILLALGIPVLSSAIYFLPMWLLFSLALADENNSPRHSI